MAGNDVFEKLEKGRIKLYDLEDSMPAGDAVRTRREFIEKKTGTKLENIESHTIDVEAATNKNIENMIGASQIPLGVAGPLKIEGDFAKGDFYIPLATTEGALVASVNRGCQAVTEAGGARVFVENKGMTRAPVFRTSGLKESREFAAWAANNFARIKAVAESTTRFGELKKIKPWICGRNVYLRFVFDTKDAMGMNMAVIACDKVVRDLVEKETKVKCIALSGNMCTDKKPAFMNLIKGRGKIVHAEAVIPAEIAEKVLKAKPADVVDVNIRKNLVGSALAGSLGFNAHFANTVAAIYIATGQDPAHVVEGSLGVTTAELQGHDLYVSVYMPSVNIGTVGGGTGLATQKEALDILGVSGAGTVAGENSIRFAEIIGAAALAGEISLLGALASGDLARAHVRLGRGK